MHKPDEKKGEKEIGKKGTEQEKKPFFLRLATYSTSYKLPVKVKVISRVDDVFDYY